MTTALKQHRHFHPILLALVFFCLPVASPVALGETSRMQEINTCSEGEISTWGDGLDHPANYPELVFAYDPANAPARFQENVVAGMVAKAAVAWSACGVPTRVVSLQQAQASLRPVIRVQWNETESRGNFGLSNPGKHALSLSPKAFDALHAANPRHDAKETLQMVISHEMGHHYGLMAHSRRCVDVLSYYRNDKGEQCYKRNPYDHGGVVEYRHQFPTACDIRRCRQVNAIR